MTALRTANKAFGQPGIGARWTSARKEAIGTAYATASRVWFTLWQGILTEIYYPTVDHPQVRDLQYLITDGKTFFHEEKRHLVHKIEVIDDSLGYRVVQSDPDGRYRIIKEIISDPHLPCVLMKTRLEGDEKLLPQLRLFALCAPHMGVGGQNNNAQVADIPGAAILTANKGNTWMALAPNYPFSKVSCGYAGYSDGWHDLVDDLQMDWQFDTAPDGNVALTGQLKLDSNNECVLGLAFGHGAHSAISTLLQSLSTDFERQKERFIQQWSRAVSSKAPLGSISSDNGALFNASYKLLMSHEDKLNPGAMIASLSIPWGEAHGDEDLGGYHLVWPRDLVNSVTALLAAGNRDTPLRALVFLAASQRADGSFPQNFWISGDPYWQGMQMDEISFPIMLAWKLRRDNALSGFDPYPMAMKAAAYVMLNGPITHQERWEEVGGYSPSTLAANIAAFICAAGFAHARGDKQTATLLEDYADYLRCHIATWTVTEHGTLHPDISEHFVRINPVMDARATGGPDGSTIFIANRRGDQPNNFLARDIVDAGFLELVRYGVYDAHDPLIVNSVAVIDRVLKVDTPFGPCWRRYNFDGYGQNDDGSAFEGTGVGRPWPLLTGERGHYELAAGRDAKPFIKAIEQFASPTGPIPEQIWDATDIPDAYLFKGKPTGSAMPLAWAHGEYIKLLRSVKDGKVFDLIPEVHARYVEGGATCQLIEMWRKNWQIPAVRPGFTLRIMSDRPFRLLSTQNDWAHSKTSECTPTALNVSFVDEPIPHGQQAPLKFTFFWLDNGTWEGNDYQVAIRRD
jgi:glucoamylase